MPARAALVLMVSGFCGLAEAGPPVDWLVAPLGKAVECREIPERQELVLTNGLLRRTFRLRPNFATVDLTHLGTGGSLLRGVKPEAVLILDGRRVAVGGLKGQPDYGFLLPEWLARMTTDPGAFQMAGYRVEKPTAPYPWQARRHAADAPWPPRGLRLTVDFLPPRTDQGKYDGLRVSVHYEMYEELPVVAKWVTIRNGTAKEVVVDGLDCEILAVAAPEKPRLMLRSDYSFGGARTASWEGDPDFLTQPDPAPNDFHADRALLLVSRYAPGPGAHLAPGASFESYRAMLIVHDSEDRERQGLALRRTYRTLAPQVTENPIFMHCAGSDSASIRRSVDQCAEVGFEMVVLTFGSGFNIESEDPAYIARIKADFDYAHQRGIEIGGYTLMVHRDRGPANDVITREGKPFPISCNAATWSDEFVRRVLRFIDATGLDVVETDGPYHGSVCYSTHHAYHRGLADSQWTQWRRCNAFYYECRRRNVFIHTPDFYFFAGANRCAMGYREDNFSLPRWQQILHARMNIFDGTFGKTPSMGWMFVPLVTYKGGGETATIEPLAQHLAEYEWYLAQNFGAGVQACYRGPRLFDTEETKALVRKWVGFYKRHRAILDSDIIHVRRPDGRDIDAILHVNPQLPDRGLAMVYNPTDQPIATVLKLPLYYTGLTGRARVSREDERAEPFDLDAAGNAWVPLRLAPRGMTWLVIRRREGV